MARDSGVHSVDLARVGILVSLLAASVLLYASAAMTGGTILGLVSAILGGLLIVLAAAISLGSSSRPHSPRTAVFTAGAVTIVLGLIAVWWGAGQCLSLVYDPLCTVKFYGSIYGGVSASVGGTVWIVYWAVKDRAGPQHS